MTFFPPTRVASYRTLPDEITDMRTISTPVGAGVKALNRCDDVRTIQEMLNAISPDNGGAKPHLKVDGKCGDKTKGAFQHFQLRHFGWELADGRVDPGGPTWIRTTVVPCTFSRLREISHCLLPPKFTLRGVGPSSSRLRLWPFSSWTARPR